jgi:metallo-beta-lactamase family protein
LQATFYSLGAAQEVTGSKHILEIDGKSYLIDCGSFQGHRAEADRKNRNFPLAPDKIEAAILTHGHLDHCGLFPLLVKKGYKGNIYTTPASRDIASLVMQDSAKIMDSDARFLKRQADKHGEKFDWRPLYDAGDAVRATGQMVGVSYNRPFPIDDGIKVEFYDAGHILGSAMAYFTINKGGRDLRILATGDLGRSEKPIIRNPERPPAADYIILESTYGDRLHGSTQDAEMELGEIATRCVRNRGKILIPAFAIERTQDLV